MSIKWMPCVFNEYLGKIQEQQKQKHHKMLYQNGECLLSLKSCIIMHCQSKQLQLNSAILYGLIISMATIRVYFPTDIFQTKSLL